MNPSLQEHDGALFVIWQWELGPQGVGWQGFKVGGISSALKERKKYQKKRK